MTQKGKVTNDGHHSFLNCFYIHVFRKGNTVINGLNMQMQKTEFERTHHILSQDSHLK